MIKKTAILIIKAYQHTFSPDHSSWGKARYPYGYCRFYPSCSEYAKRSIEEKGLVKGVCKGVWRVVRCNPFSRGGYDPIIRNS